MTKKKKYNTPLLKTKHSIIRTLTEQMTHFIISGMKSEVIYLHGEN